MSLYFRSIRSNSKGNCLAVWTDSTSILIDCGLNSMKRTKQILRTEHKELEDIHAVLLTHMHSDHISHYPLRVMESNGWEVFVHSNCVNQLKKRHYWSYHFNNLKLRPYQGSFTIGDIEVEPFELPHNPAYITHGFRVTANGKTLVLATDFNSWHTGLDKFLNADLVFLESNHDLNLLTLNYNPNSQYHLPNPKAAQLVYEIATKSDIKPATVILGHLSELRNKAFLAEKEVHRLFEAKACQIEFDLVTAPLNQSSAIFEVGNGSKKENCPR